MCITFKQAAPPPGAMLSAALAGISAVIGAGVVAHAAVHAEHQELVCVWSCVVRLPQAYLSSLNTRVMGTKATPSAPGRYSAPKLELVSLLPAIEELLTVCPPALRPPAAAAAAAAVRVVLCKLMYELPPARPQAAAGAECRDCATDAPAAEGALETEGAVPLIDVFFDLYPAKLAAMLLMMLLAPPGSKDHNETARSKG